jgi:hypothetical protein
MKSLSSRFTRTHTNKLSKPAILCEATKMSFYIDKDSGREYEKL